MDVERQRLINEAARIVNNIDQIFLDVAYWNESHPEDEPISADPDGEMFHWKRGLTEMLEAEAARGNYPSVLPIKARRRRYVPVLPEPQDLTIGD